MTEIFGIDLGTTNSCIATIDELGGQPVVIKNSFDMQTTPSVIYFDEYDQPLVGDEAKRSMAMDPSRAVAFIKREMSNATYRRMVGNVEVTPIMASHLILRKLVDDANAAREFEGKKPVKKAVITVPAYFGNDERERTRKAGELAGLEVIDLVNEPTAAALSYGKATFTEGKTVMVYDLGGGTFDVSIIKMRNGKLDTISTDGDHKLGGVDWDATLVDFALLSQGLDVTYDDIADKKEGGQLILEAEKCKKMLSTNDKAPMKFRYKGKMMSLEVTRAVFEELTSEKLNKTINCVRRAVQLAKVEDSDLKIDEIILVGGSSRMPMVRRKLEKEFPDVKIRMDRFEPDLAVAKGAAIHAQNLTEKTTRTGRPMIGVDKGSRSYGVNAIDTSDGNTEKIFNLLYRTEPLEIDKKIDGFSTYAEGQTKLSIKFYENASPEYSLPINKGNLLQTATIDWGTPVPKGTPITYNIIRGKDGIVHIAAQCQGKSCNVTIDSGKVISDDEMRRIKSEFEDIEL